ncbi:MAG: tail fiber domain-containing protein [Chloroflexota bacterium]
MTGKYWGITFAVIVILSLLFDFMLAPISTPEAVKASSSEPAPAWSLSGASPVEFFGATGDAPPELRIDQQRGLHLEPAPQVGPGLSPNRIGGYEGNTAADGVWGAVIGGGGQLGFPNRVLDNFGTIAGGSGNKAGELAAVGGGLSNTARGYRAVIGGGFANTATGGDAAIGGGMGNIARHSFTAIGGGLMNVAEGLNATIGGGAGNLASSPRATVGGGTQNKATGLDSLIGGGVRNSAEGAYSAVGGGLENHALGRRTVVGGGGGNIAGGDEATIGGGLSNRAADRYSTVAGGRGNLAGNLNDNGEDARYATVGGGQDNAATGLAATVGGGLENVAGGDFSVAAGRRAHIDPHHDGAFLFADSTNADFDSAAANEFAARATGGVRLVTAVDAAGLPLAGVRLAAGSGSWETLSDEAVKANVRPVDPYDVLELLMDVPISTWHYRTQDPSIRHIGPTAQDFYQVFKVGAGERTISTVDADGVALAAIQGLYELVQAQQAEISALKEQLAALENRLGALQTEAGIDYGQLED